MKNNISKYIFILVVLGLIGFALYNLYNDERNKENIGYTDSGEKIEGTRLTDMRVGIAGFDTINPILSKNRNVQELSKLIFDSLLTINEEYRIQNNIVSEYSLVGEKDYLIKLKEGIKWNDGTELTAADIKFTIDKIKDNNINSIYKESLKDVTDLEIIDEHTIRINLSKAVPFFEYNLTFPILCSSYYEGEDFLNTSKNNHPLSTGAYIVTSTESEEFVLKRNPAWWNGEEKLPYIETIHIKMYSNMGECYNAFKTGNIDFVTTNNISWKEHVGTIGYATREYHGREYDFIAFNFKNDLLSRQEVREAIALSIDKNKINGNVYNNQNIISNSLLDYGNWLYNGETQIKTYNFEKAQEVLKNAGWEYKNDSWQKIENYRTLKLSFTLIVNSSNNLRVKAAENIKQDLEKIGIWINIKSVTDSQYNNYLSNKNYDMILTGKILSFSPDLSGFLAEGNLANYENTEVKGILKEVTGIDNGEVLREKYKRLLEITNTELPYVYLYYNKNIFIYSYSLTGRLTPNWYSIFYNIDTWSRQK